MRFRLIDSLLDYPTNEQDEIISKILFIETVIDKIDELFEAENKKMTESINNIVYINPSIKTNFLSLKNSSIKLKDLVNNFENWSNQLLELAINNIGQYHIISVQRHVEEIMNVCKMILIIKSKK